MDHCICTADVHDCLEELEILYDLATTDIIPVSMMLNVESLPKISNYDNYEHSGKLDWANENEN